MHRLQLEGMIQNVVLKLNSMFMLLLANKNNPPMAAHGTEQEDRKF